MWLSGVLREGVPVLTQRARGAPSWEMAVALAKLTGATGH